MQPPNRPADTVPPRLSVVGLSVLGAPGTGRLLRTVSFDLAPGRTLVLLGGADDGTSLLLDAIAGHASIGSGIVLRDGRGVDQLPAEQRGFGMVSDRDTLFPHLDVAGNIDFPLRARGLDKAERRRRVADALALLGLDPVADNRPTALDAANRVRTAVARALASDPAVLLLDTPFQSLHPREREQFRRTLRRLATARGLTMLLTTEDREEALLLGDRIGVLDAGVLHQVGTGQDLLERPGDAVVAARIGDANLLPGRIVESDEEVALVRLATGQVMEGEPCGTLEPGAACMLAVRPDRIATAFLSRSQAGVETGADSLPGTLQDAVHLGDHFRLRFRLADGTEILVRRPPAASAADLRPGRIALLAWQPHQARVFPMAN